MERLGRYTLLERIAAGGMAEVFLARAEGPAGFEKVVALKRVLPEVAGDAVFGELFEREARLAAGLDHPNVVHVWDFGAEGGTRWLAMEYVRGPSLRAALRRGIPPPEVALHVARECARALAFAHGRGVVHRDVTPENVLLSEAGAVKLADFGIAGLRESAARTAPGVVRGKEGWVAPEVLRGEAASVAADVWALGRLLGEMLGAGGPAELRSLADRAAATRPEERFASAEELALALARAGTPSDAPERLAAWLRTLFPEGFEGTRRTAASGARRFRRPRRAAILAALTVAALLALLFVLGGDEGAPGHGSRATTAPVAGPVTVAAPVPVAAPATVPVAVSVPATATGTAARAEPLRKPPSGFLTVDTKPRGHVYIDGRLIGRSPLRRYALEPGTYRLTVENQNLGTRRERSVEIRSGEEILYETELF
jgi:serine/threonine-protein kinase